MHTESENNPTERTLSQAEGKQHSMEKEKIDRINELARAKRERGLTELEHAEQKELHAEYIKAFRASMTGILDNTVIKRPNGETERLADKKRSRRK